jgi:hypothetical protein
VLNDDSSQLSLNILVVQGGMFGCHVPMTGNGLPCILRKYMHGQHGVTF